MQDVPECAPLVAALTATEPLVESPMTVIAPSDDALAEIADVLADMSPEMFLAVHFFLVQVLLDNHAKLTQKCCNGFREVVVPRADFQDDLSILQ